MNTTLEQIKSEEQKITDLNNCYTTNQDSFDIDTTECVLSDGSTVPYNTLYGELLQTAYGSNNYNSFINTDFERFFTFLSIGNDFCFFLSKAESHMKNHKGFISVSYQVSD